MNKMVIMDIDKTCAICMKNDGTVCRIRNKNYYVGEEITMSRNIKQSLKRLSYAFAVMIILAAGSAFAAVKIPYGYVSLDVNPSVQYAVNIFGDVISVEGVNQDGEAVLENIDINNIEGQNIETALAQTLIQIARDGYVSSIEDPLVVIATSSNDDEENQALVQKVNDEISYILNNEQEDSEEPEEGDDGQEGSEEPEEGDDGQEDSEEPEEGDDGQEDSEEPQEGETPDDVEGLLENIDVEVVGVGRERVLEARELGISPGKLNLIEKYIEASGDDDIDILEWSEKTVKEIQKATQSAKGIGNNGDDEGEVDEEQDINRTEPEDDEALNEDESEDGDEDKSDEENGDEADVEEEDDADNKDEDGSDSDNSSNSKNNGNGNSNSGGNGNSESNGKSSSSNNGNDNSSNSSNGSSSSNGNGNSGNSGNGNSGNNGKNK